jgi:hypothetical protein
MTRNETIQAHQIALRLVSGLINRFVNDKLWDFIYDDEEYWDHIQEVRQHLIALANRLRINAIQLEEEKEKKENEET